MNITVWTARRGEPAAAEGVSHPRRLGQGRECDPLLIPLPPDRGGIAVLLVPEPLCGAITCNGRPLDAGAHMMAHADALAWDEFQAWPARSESPTETVYDPEVHGANVACARTRSPLKTGEKVIVCPGTASTECGRLYRAAAWLNTRCVVCGFEPGAAAWRPPQKEQEDYHELLQIAEKTQP